jgi:predicted acetyltransferase
MDLELRPITDDELREYIRVMEGAFGYHASRETIEEQRPTIELDRTIAGFDGSEIVATAGAYSFQLTLPGGRLEPAAGVTAVAVRVTHRRRGLLRAMMTHQLDDVADRGEALALLTASEGPIYRRFGYGPATTAANWRIPTQRAQFWRQPDTGGQMREVTRTDAQPVLPQVYDRCRRHIPGAVQRIPAWWDIWFADHQWTRDGASARFYAWHETDGQPDGYVAFRQRTSWEHGLAGNTLVIDELIGATAEIEAALWRHAIDHDLVTTIVARNRPVDEALRWWLTDPRLLTCTQVVDRLWVRVLDVPRALAARTYGTVDALVLEVVDPSRPANDGRYLVEGGPEGASCDRTDREPDLAMDVAELGSIYLGGVSPTALARSGRITEHSSGALARAEAFFGTAPLPWLTTGF